MSKVTEYSPTDETLQLLHGKGIEVDAGQLNKIFSAMAELSQSEIAGDGLLQNIYIPDWNNKPPETPPILSLAGTPILTHQNSMAIIAHPGGGKSSNMEAIIASTINPSSDNLSYEATPACKGAIWIDNERTNIDVWNSFQRICRRTGVPHGEVLRNIVIAGMRSVPRLTERRTAIMRLLDRNPCSLLLIDGAGDLVNDTNNLEEAIECRIWIRELTVKYDLSVILTLHPNPNSNKPRGHQGSEICREAESVLLLRPYEGDIRLITTDFENGKNRNNAKITAAFAWSDEKKMFLTASYDGGAGKVSPKLAKEAKELAQDILPAPTSMRHNELKKAIMNRLDCADKTAKRKIQNMLTEEVIDQGDDGLYRMKI